MKYLMIIALFFSSSVIASDIRLEFSNGWVIELDDSQFVNYDHKGAGEKAFYHRNHILTSFSGATATEAKDNSEWVILSGVFKHTIGDYRHRGDLSVIEFTMTVRELANRQTVEFRQNKVLFETKKKPFKDISDIKDALIKSFQEKYVYQATQLRQYGKSPEKNEESHTEVTLKSISIDGVPVEPEHSMLDSFLGYFKD